jgi:hypothetical protein
MSMTRPYRRLRYTASGDPETFVRVPSHPYAPFPPGQLRLLDRGVDTDGHRRLMIELRGRVAGFVTETPRGGVYVGTVAAGENEGSLVVRFNGRQGIVVDYMPDWIATYGDLVTFTDAINTRNDLDG